MTDDGHYGQIGVQNVNSEFNAHAAHMKRHISHVRTTIPVKIIKVHGGGVGAAPTVDVQPLINQIDNMGNKTDHGTIYGIPIIRNQGGKGAIINDPQVGDVYQMHVADRDISSLKANNGKQSNPGSYRRHDLADGIGHGLLLAPTPTTYVWFKPDGGVKIVDKGGNRIETFPNGNGDCYIYVRPPAANKMVYLGGDPTQHEGTYDFVSTSSGPSVNVKARIS